MGPSYLTGVHYFIWPTSFVTTRRHSSARVSGRFHLSHFNWRIYETARKMSAKPPLYRSTSTTVLLSTEDYIGEGPSNSSGVPITEQHFPVLILIAPNQSDFKKLTLILLTWRIWWAPNNASRWQMGFNWVLKGLMSRHVPSTLNESVTKYEGWNFNSGNYLFTTDTK